MQFFKFFYLKRKNKFSHVIVCVNLFKDPCRGISHFINWFLMTPPLDLPVRSWRDRLGYHALRKTIFQSYSLFTADERFSFFVKRFSFSFTRFEQLIFLISDEESWILLERFETRLLELRLFLKTPIIIILNTILFFLSVRSQAGLENFILCENVFSFRFFSKRNKNVQLSWTRSLKSQA